VSEGMTEKRELVRERQKIERAKEIIQMNDEKEQKIYI
jgi:hypothetical protein